MKYMGSKSRIAEEILEVIDSIRTNQIYFHDLFSGGLNLTQFLYKYNYDLVIANDINKYIMSFFYKCINEKDLSFIKKYSRNEYNHIKNNKHMYEDHVVGYVGVCCSYSGKFFGGYAGLTKTKKGIRDYQLESFKNIEKQIFKLKNINLKITSYSFEDIVLPHNSVIYCDIPYKGTSGYKTNFNHSFFYDKIRTKPKSSIVFLSEYEAPSFFTEVWSKEVKSSLSSNGKIGGSKISKEKLFIYK